MNGYPLVVAAIVILAVAAISGAAVLGMLGVFRLTSDPPWRKRKPMLVPAGAHHRSERQEK